MVIFSAGITISISQAHDLAVCFSSGPLVFDEGKPDFHLQDDHRFATGVNFWAL